jgi:hypothetical protein
MAPDRPFGVYFDHDDSRNRGGLSLDSACIHAAACIRPGELAEILVEDVVFKVCKRGDLGPAWFEDL